MADVAPVETGEQAQITDLATKLADAENHVSLLQEQLAEAQAEIERWRTAAAVTEAA